MNKLIAADYSNIEGRVLMSLAGEEWKLQAYRDFDAGRGPDLYKVAYARAFDMKPKDVSKDQRQIGKVMELALGYQGGPGAFETMARGYGVNIGGSYDTLAEALPAAHERAHAAWKSRGVKSGMAMKTWLAAEMIKVAWRAAHPRTVQFWWELQDAALQAIREPGVVVSCGPLKFRMAGSAMYMRLPSGRALCYPYPRVAVREVPWDDQDGKPAMRPTFSYMGPDTYTRQWGVRYAYGGLWAENATQAAARDILAEAVTRLEDRKYFVVMTVHDEIVSEVPSDFGSVEEFCAIMTKSVPWLPGCPITAEGWQGAYYRK